MAAWQVTATEGVQITQEANQTWEDYAVTCESIHGSNVVSTHLWNTPLNLYQQAIKGVFPGVCSRGVW